LFLEEERQKKTHFNSKANGKATLAGTLRRCEREKKSQKKFCCDGGERGIFGGNIGSHPTIQTTKGGGEKKMKKE